MVAEDCTATAYCGDSKRLVALPSGECAGGRCLWQTGVEETCVLSCVAGNVARCAAGGRGGSPHDNTLPEERGRCEGATVVASRGFGFAGHTTYSTRTPCLGGCVETDAGSACVAALDQMPIYTCFSEADCPPAPEICVTGEPDTKRRFAGASCFGSLCQWLSSVPVACASGTTCTGAACPD